MINELDDVILTCDLPEHGLSAGDIGTVVLVARGHRGYEVEFTSLEGDPLAVETPRADQVRLTHAGEIAHARELAAKGSRRRRKSFCGRADCPWRKARAATRSNSRGLSRQTSSPAAPRART